MHRVVPSQNINVWLWNHSYGPFVLLVPLVLQLIYRLPLLIKKIKLEAEGRLKSKIICNNQLLEEAQQLWDLGTTIGLEAYTCHLCFIQSFADIEARDRNEAMELGERKTHR